jgi:hypothetical protein
MREGKNPKVDVLKKLVNTNFVLDFNEQTKSIKH